MICRRLVASTVNWSMQRLGGNACRTSQCGVKLLFVLIMDAWASAFLRGTNCYKGNNSLRTGGPCHQGLWSISLSLLHCNISLTERTVFEAFSAICPEPPMLWCNFSNMVAKTQYSRQVTPAKPLIFYQEAEDVIAFQGSRSLDIFAVSVEQLRKLPDENLVWKLCNGTRHASH